MDDGHHPLLITRFPQPAVQMMCTWFGGGFLQSFLLEFTMGWLSFSEAKLGQPPRYTCPHTPRAQTHWAEVLRFCWVWALRDREKGSAPTLVWISGLWSRSGLFWANRSGFCSKVRIFHKNKERTLKILHFSVC